MNFTKRHEFHHDNPSSDMLYTNPFVLQIILIFECLIMNYTSLVDADLVENGFQKLSLQPDDKDLLRTPSSSRATYPYLQALLGDNPPTPGPGLFEPSSFNNNDISFSNGDGGSSLFSREFLEDLELGQKPNMFQFSSDLFDGHSSSR